MPHQSPPEFGNSTAILKTMMLVQKLALTRYPLLLLGPKGTGKTLLARWIHDLSARPGPLVERSAAIPDSLAQGELLGHGRGAYTGAHNARAGYFEQARTGTLFLDELGDAPPVVQHVLLTLIEADALYRLGEVRSTPLDVRLIAATNADLDAMIDAGTFRGDLRDRFGPFVLTMPPLAERRDEILPLARRFVATAATQLNRVAPNPLSSEVQEAFLAAAWPDNVRGLRNACTFGATLAEPGEPIRLEHLPEAFSGELPRSAPRRYERSADGVRRALEDADGNRTRAAELYGVERPHFHVLMRRFGVQHGGSEEGRIAV